MKIHTFWVIAHYCLCWQFSRPSFYFGISWHLYGLEMLVFPPVLRFRTFTTSLLFCFWSFPTQCWFNSFLAWFELWWVSPIFVVHTFFGLSRLSFMLVFMWVVIVKFVSINIMSFNMNDLHTFQIFFPLNFMTGDYLTRHYLVYKKELLSILTCNIYQSTCIWMILLHMYVFTITLIQLFHVSLFMHWPIAII